LPFVSLSVPAHLLFVCFGLAVTIVCLNALLQGPQNPTESPSNPAPAFPLLHVPLFLSPVVAPFCLTLLFWCLLLGLRFAVCFRASQTNLKIDLACRNSQGILSIPTILHLSPSFRFLPRFAHAAQAHTKPKLLLLRL
jgi:hypothetical protein